MLSTNVEFLTKITHPIASLVLQHRKLFHTINTYTEALPKFAFFRNSSNMIRIYSTILQVFLIALLFSFFSHSNRLSYLLVDLRLLILIYNQLLTPLSLNQ